MRFRTALFLILFLVGIAAVCFEQSMQADEKKSAGTNNSFTKEHVQYFERNVLPLLKANCFKCHGAEPKIKGNFKLTSRAGLLKGGDIGPAIDLKKLGKSELLAAINYDGLEMPRTGKLKPDQITILTKWINDGAAWSSTKDYGVETVHEVDKRGDGKDYWAYQTIKRPKTPSAKNQA